jgi:hypothetical protein
VRARGYALLALLAMVALAGCGGGSSDTSTSSIAGGADPESVKVIQDWANDLRAGDLEAAADHFKVPSIVANGTPPIDLSNHEQVVAFNRSLPCGAELTRAETQGRFTIATFELTERPGRGTCGQGVGETAQTAFVIEDGKITQWRRVDEAPAAEPAPQGPVI